MSNPLVIQQFQFEVERWQRMLSFYQQENDHLKNRLAEFLSGLKVSENLEVAELLQANMLQQDEIIHFYGQELYHQRALLEKEVYLDGKILQLVTRNQRKLRKDLQKEQELFLKIEQEFNDYTSPDDESL